MTSPSQVNLRIVVASSLAFSLLIFSSFASAQGLLGTPNGGSGIKVESTADPVVQDTTVVTLPGAGSSTKPAAGSSTKPAAGSSTKPAAGSSTKPAAGSSTKPAAGSSTKPAAGSSTKPFDGSTSKPFAGSSTKPAAGLSAEDKLELEKRRADWMSELENLTFKELVKRIRDDEQKINNLYIRIPLGYPAKQREFQDAIAALQAEVVVLNQLLEPAAIEAFRSDPTGSRAEAVKVFEVLASKLSPRGRNSRYDPKEGLRLVNTILEIKGGDIGTELGVTPLPEDEPFVRVIFQGYLASYGLQDFASAEKFLTRLENMEIGLDPKVRETFEETLEAWEKEKSLRADEAKVDNLPRVKLETTDGDVVIELFENEAPNTVANFIKLTREGYYDGLEFFQVVPSSYARSGCTANDGTTHPGYRIHNEFENGRRHFAGTVVMQNDGENTAGSQFIILHRPDPKLQGKVVSFGRVVEGLENVYQFKTVNRIRIAGGEATIINKATVIRNPAFEYKLETIDDASGLLFEGPGEVLSDGLAPGDSSYQPKRGGSSAILPPSGYSTRPVVVPSGSSSRPSGGSGARPSSGSGARPSGGSGAR